MKITKYFLTALILLNLYGCKDQVTDVNETNGTITKFLYGTVGNP